MELAQQLTGLIRDIPDYPKPGVMFKDITPLLADAAAFSALVDAVADRYRPDAVTGPAAAPRTPITKVVGMEARGFILAAPVAYRLGVGFVPVRKAGKLPHLTHRADYALEYGTATLEVHTDAFTAGDRVLILDDVLATGGTIEATVDLVRRAGAEVADVCVLLELAFLKGRDRLAGLLQREPYAVLTQ